ncbi:MAG: hypothetical protein R3C03_12875 [Pirellulaceae bacterium]
MNLSQTIDNASQETKCKWSPWHGETLTGWPVSTWVMGHQAFQLANGRAEFDTTHLGQELTFRGRRS